MPPITKTIQVRRARHAGHCWRSKDKLISDVLLWTPTYGQAKAGRPAWTYIQQLCEDTGCNPEDLPEAMNDREKWRERVRDICAGGTTWWWWYICVCVCFFACVRVDSTIQLQMLDKKLFVFHFVLISLGKTRIHLFSPTSAMTIKPGQMELFIVSTYIYIYVCVCIYVHTCLCIYIYIYIYIHAYLHTCI